jgi:hypothetical protein
MKTIKSYRNQADRLWYQILMLRHQYCEVCSLPAQQIHHFFFKGSCGHLRYDLDNGIGMCMHCHSLLHFKDAKLIESLIIEKRGEDWYHMLLLKARDRPTSFSTTKWYKGHIDRLKEIYDNM